jgi:hypothetical protein
MKDRLKTPYKLNILALPNQTTILFGLIVVVLLGTILAGSVGSPPFMWPLALGLLLLPLRAFLAWPEREFKKYKLIPAGDEFTSLVKVIEEEAKAIGLPRTPELVISRGDVVLHIMGSLRHWYVAISRNEALRLRADLEDNRRTLAVHAMFIHELYHFKNGDYWQMGYAREFLRITATFMTWAIAFLMGYGFFLLVVQPDILQMDFGRLIGQMEGLTPEMRELYLSLLPSPEAWAEVQTKAAEVDLGSVLYFIGNATLPFIVTGSILWLFYWRKLLRIRELYADAGVAHTQKGIEHWFPALLLGSRFTADRAGPSKMPLLSKAKLRIRKTLVRVRSALTPPTFIRRLFSTHPEFKRRVDALENPALAYDRWSVTALSLGGLALILDILLSTPLMLPYHGLWPMHFSVLVISVVVTLTLMTPLVLGESAWKRILKTVGVIGALRFVWLSLTIGLMLLLLVLAPRLLSVVLDSAIKGIARYAGRLPGPIVDDLSAFVLQASWLNMAQVFIIPASLVSLIGANVLLLRRLLTWYSLPRAEQRLLRVAYGTIAVTTTSFGLAILVPVTTALLRSEELFGPTTIAMGLVGLIVAVVGLGLFIYADRRYAGRCPGCGAHVPGPYWLGKRCDDCDELLHPWMIAEYEL